jgi:hypothetical protein
LAWIEATAAGAIVLAPGPGKASQWEEWQRPGIVHYHNREEFGSKLREVMTSYTNAGNFSGHVAASRKYLQQELMLGQVNQLRWEILNELWEKRNGRT